MQTSGSARIGATAALLVASAVLFVPALAAAVPDDRAPESIARDFIEAGKNADHDTFLGLLTSGARAVMAGNEGAQAGGPTGEYTIGGAVVEDDIARVPITAMEGGVEQHAELRMRREDDAWRVFGVAMTGVPGQPEFFIDFEHPEAVLNALTDAIGEGLQTAFGGSSESEPLIEAVDAAAFVASWQPTGEIRGQAAREALQPIARSLGLEVDWSEGEESASHPVTLSLDEVTPLQALEEICRQAGVHPVYQDETIAIRPEPRTMPVAFAGPFLFEVVDLREYPPYATGTLTVALRAYGLPAAVISSLSEQADQFQIEEIRDETSGDLRDYGAPHAWSGPMISGAGFSMSLEINLANLVRGVSAIAAVRARLPLTLPTSVAVLPFTTLEPGESQSSGEARITLKGVPVEETISYGFELAGVDLDRLQLVPRDAGGNPMPVNSRSGESSGDEGSVEITLDAAPASIDARFVSEEDTQEFVFALENIPLQHVSEMPAELRDVQYSGDAPVTAEVTGMGGDESFRTLQVAVLNRSDKAVRHLDLKMVYWDKDGNQLEDWPHDQFGPADYAGEGAPIIVEAGGKTMLEFTAFFMPEETAKTTIEVRGVGFADATEWMP